MCDITTACVIGEEVSPGPHIPLIVDLHVFFQEPHLLDYLNIFVGVGSDGNMCLVSHCYELVRAGAGASWSELGCELELV